MDILIQLILLAVGFFMLVKGADWFVDGSSGIASKFGIPQHVIGLTVVAMGTSAPEAAVSITAALNENADITVGNIVGSNIFNILFVVGLSSTIIPVPFASGFVFDTIVAAAAGVLLLVCSIKKRMLKRWSGIVMLLAYAVYFAAIW
ncbi:MAG: sodium:calcium antiporter [Ruminococcaceae bacterium]|nr:sodium:calcium antiporter [Oscillospiraceae bacterium]